MDATGYDLLEQYRIAAVKRGDKPEAERLARLMERLDQHREAYGREQRELYHWHARSK